jgi:hypothetical protein
VLSLNVLSGLSSSTLVLLVQTLLKSCVVKDSSLAFALGEAKVVEGSSTLIYIDIGLMVEENMLGQFG